MKSDYLVMSERVQEALDNKKPVIAIVTAGLLNCDLEDIEKVVAQKGAVPALMAVFDGKVHVGLDKTLRKRLTENKGNQRRVSRSDLPVVLATGEDGVLTVSATMMVARMSEISVVVSTYVGGVSTAYKEDMKVSSDIEELAQDRMVVVCSGFRSGVDAERTMEFMETHGVPIVGFRSDHFYTDEEHSVNFRLNDPTDIASAIAVKRSLDIEGSLLVVNPVDVSQNAVLHRGINDDNPSESDREMMTEIVHDNITLAAWIATAIAMDLDPNIHNRNSKRSSIPKKEKSMSFEVWLFAVKGFAQNYDVAQLIFNNLPDSEKERLRTEYDETVE